MILSFITVEKRSVHIPVYLTSFSFDFNNINLANIYLKINVQSEIELSEHCY